MSLLISRDWGILPQSCDRKPLSSSTGVENRPFVLALVMAVCSGVGGGVAQDVAQVSGVPGDGVPDFYYFPTDGLQVETSAGPITRPAGDLTMDTDGVSVVAMFVGGPDATGNCNLCGGMNLPGPDALTVSTWTLGYSGDVIQYLGVGPPFVGVVGNSYVDGTGVSQPWPAGGIFVDFPDRGRGLLTFPGNLSDTDFTIAFSDGMGGRWNVQVVTDSIGGFFTNVTVVPEPVSNMLMALAMLMALGRRHHHAIKNR